MLRFPIMTLGTMLCGLGALLSAIALIDLGFGSLRMRDFAVAAFVCFVFGGAIVASLRVPLAQIQTVDRREAFLLTAITWLVFPFFAALPFLSGPEPLSITDALFESVSGLTTTGATVLVNLDEHDPAILIWRSVMQWIGGIGIIVMAVVMLPYLRVGGMQLFQLESSDRSGDKIIARPGALIGTITSIYFALTCLCTGLYSFLGMPLFDAVNHGMTTVATGGFSTHDNSLGYFESVPIFWVGAIFMLAGAVPFMVYYRALRGNLRVLVEDAQILTFFAIVVLVCVLGSAYRILVDGAPAAEAITQLSVNAISIMTTTGYATADYSAWGPAFLGLFFALTFMGGCAGSTTGSIKIYRFQILFILSRDHLRRLYSPHMVQPRRYGTRKIDGDISLSVLAFLALFVGALSVGIFALNLCGLDFLTAVSGAAAALCNIGPGLGETIGPAGNYQSLPDNAKWIMIFLMLLGRLELFALLVLLDPQFWRR